jgi:hypothetical protein
VDALRVRAERELQGAQAAHPRALRRVAELDAQLRRRAQETQQLQRRMDGLVVSCEALVEQAARGEGVRRGAQGLLLSSAAGDEGGGWVGAVALEQQLCAALEISHATLQAELEAVREDRISRSRCDQHARTPRPTATPSSCAPVAHFRALL